MDAKDIEAIVQEYLSSLKGSEGACPLEGGLPAAIPRQAYRLARDITANTISSVDIGTQELFSYAVCIALDAHASTPRDTGGSAYLHDHFVAKSVMALELPSTGMAAVLHDVFEDTQKSGVRESDAIAGLVQKLRDYIHSRTGDSKFQEKPMWTMPFSSELEKETAAMGIIVNKLTKREDENLFQYTDRMLCVPDCRWVDRQRKRLGMRSDEQKEMDSFFKAIGFKAEHSKHGRESFVNYIVKDTLSIKCRDRGHNITTMDATSEEYADYPAQKQLFEIYKNIILIAEAKRDSRICHLMKDNVHANALIDSSLEQLYKLKDLIMAASPDIQNNRLLYDVSVKAYELAGGLKESTKYRQTRLPRKPYQDITEMVSKVASTLDKEPSLAGSGLPGLDKIIEGCGKTAKIDPIETWERVKGVCSRIDGTMSTYAGFIYAMREHPREIDVPHERLYLDCLDFIAIFQKLRDDPRYAPDFTFTKRKARHYMESLREHMVI